MLQRPDPDEHGMAAVAAHVDERPQLARAVAHDGDGHRAGLGDKVGAGLGDLLGAAGVLPAAPEDPLGLALVLRRVGVPAGGQRVARAQAGRDGLEVPVVRDRHAQPPSSAKRTIRRFVRNTPRWPQSSPISSISEKSSLWLSSNVVQASA